MLNFHGRTPESLDCVYTWTEIQQQPRLWEKTLAIYEQRKEELESFLKEFQNSGQRPRIIFTGAGTSEYVGNIIAAGLSAHFPITMESIATTDLVSCPRLYFNEERPTLLISFARSGNSPESLAAVELGEQLVPSFYNLAITCAEEGALAKKLDKTQRSKVVIMPEGSNDKSFAMTSSFSCMLLFASLLFHAADLSKKKDWMQQLVDSAHAVLSQEEKITQWSETDFERIVYLGSATHYPATAECALKISELTAGQIATCNQSSMGFRHGPKSFINEKTAIIGLVSNDDYTRLYDEDILREIHNDQICQQLLAVQTKKTDVPYAQFVIEAAAELPDLFLSPLYVLFAQVVALITSIRVGNTPDNPSKTGTVNRVVKGVEIHAL